MLAVSAESCSGELMLRSAARAYIPVKKNHIADFTIGYGLPQKGSPGARLVPRKPSISMLPIICSMGGVSSGLYCRGLAWSARAGASRQKHEDNGNRDYFRHFVQHGKPIERRNSSIFSSTSSGMASVPLPVPRLISGFLAAW